MTEKKITRNLALAIALAIPSFIYAQQTEQIDSTSTSADGFNKFRIGGYGEMVANFKDYGLNRFYGSSSGSPKINHNTIAIPRFVIAGDYKFNSKWILGVEVEFEAGGTGSEVEIETGTGSENGEYEVENEKGGEVALEQFHITRLIIPEFNVRVGHLVLPVGLTNTHHEPINFFGTSRPEGETTIMPCTWHETGLEFFGNFGKGYAKFDYEAMVVAGSNPNGFDIYHWIKGGKQGLFETDNFTSPAYVARLNYRGVPGLRLGASLYWNPRSQKNCDKLVTYDGIGNVNVFLYSFDAQYSNRYFTARGNFLHGNVSNSRALSAANKQYSSLSPYSRKSPIAKTAMTYSVEAGLNLKSIFNGNDKFPVIYPFAHYEYYNPQEKGEVGQVMDERCQVSMWTAGLNWKALPNLVVKADYTTRQIGTSKIFGTSSYNSENEFGIGIAYSGWFFKK
jgi:hypothetical protein